MPGVRIRPIGALVMVAGLLPLLSGCGGESDDHMQKAINTVPTVLVTQAENQLLNRAVSLPGELTSYQDVGIFAKIEGFVQWMGVDRGSVVKNGQTIIKIIAPELDAQVSQAQAKVAAAHAEFSEAQSKQSSIAASVLEARAKKDADEATYVRLKKAAQTPGVIADIEVVVSGKTVDADNQRVSSLEQSVLAANALVRSEKDKVKSSEQNYKSLAATRAYLTVQAPFDGIITTRYVNIGSLVRAAEDKPMVRIEELNHLRLVIPVPEIDVAGVKPGKQVEFTVPAYPGRVFSGTLARISHALDQKTRTMPVELDVWNQSHDLEPGMFPNVLWRAERPYQTVFVPASAVATNMEKTYLVKIINDIAHPITVSRGQQMGNSLEVFGDVHSGDQVAIKASEELREGTKVIVKLASADDVASAGKKAAAPGGD